MKTSHIVLWLYFLANTCILTGFFFMVQPLSQTLFAWGFPIILVGIAFYLVLDHLPARFHAEPDDNGGPE